MRPILSLAFAMTLCGCIHHSYTRTSAAEYSPKDPACQFQIQSTLPDPKTYEEIGTVGGCSGTDDLAKYKKQIAKYVCKAGGDVVAAEANGYGVYCRGVVFRAR